MTLSVLSTEMVGKSVKVIRAPNGSLVGHCGMIINETKYGFVLREQNGTGTKQIPKKDLLLSSSDGNYDGNMFVGRSHERMTQ